MTLLKNHFRSYFFTVIFVFSSITKATSIGLCENLFSSSFKKTFSFSNLLINQENPQFIKYNLLTKGEASQLCGITTLANFINIKLNVFKKTMSPSDLIDYISNMSLIFRSEQLANGERNFSLKGMYSFELARLSEFLIKELNLPFSVISKSELIDNGNISASDFINNQGLILSLQFVNKKSKELGTSHFVLVTSYDPQNQQITFSDPLEPNLIKHAKLTFSSAEPNQLIRVDLENNTDMKKLVEAEEGYFDLSGLIAFQLK